MKRNVDRKKLTIAEEEIMLILWKKQEAFIKDIVDECAEPRPAYNTISTVLRVMEHKGLVGHHKSGVFYKFFPLIDKREYAAKLVEWVFEKYYDASLADMLEACLPQCTEDSLEKARQLLAR